MKRDTRQRVERPRYTEAQLREEAGGRAATHAVDLLNALLCWAVLPFAVPMAIFAKGSRNMVALRLGCLAHRDPVMAAQIIIAELTAELRSTVQRGRRRFFGDDELLSGEPYTSWTVFGWLLALRGLHEHQHPICREACRLLVEALNRQAALFALVAVPGICRNSNGTSGYQWLVARCAGLRSLVAMLRWPGSTAAVWGLLGGPVSAWHGKVPMLAEAIADLAQLFWRLAEWDEDEVRMHLHNAAGAHVGSLAWRKGVDVAGELLGDTRAAIDLEIRHYSGARLTMLLGPGAGGSTAGMRAVLVTGPECPITEQEAQRQLDGDGPIRCGDVVAAFPEPVERERGDQHGDGWIAVTMATGEERFVCTDGPGMAGKRVEMQLPSEKPTLVVRTSQDVAPVWRIAA